MTNSGLLERATTSLQRTYRYLRLGIAGTIVVITVGVLLASLQMRDYLPSISAYFYSSARTAFVGGLIAASLGILAISGKGIERALLDAAGILAPLIALISTPINAATATKLGLTCGHLESCVPSDYVVDIDVGVTSYAVVATLALFTAAILSRRQLGAPWVLASLIVTAAVIVVIVVWWQVFPESFFGDAHLYVASTFFALIAAVAFRNLRRTPGEQSQGRWATVGYWVIAIGMGLDVLATIAVVKFGIADATAVPLVMIGEFIALWLFFLFWILQSNRKWTMDDPGVAAVLDRKQLAGLPG